MLVCLPLGLYFASHPEMLWNRARQVSVFNDSHPATRVALNILKTAEMFFFHGDCYLLWRDERRAPKS
jgi:hypothetical protein